MEHRVTSTELLADAARAYDDFARQPIHEVNDPEIGLAQAYECGRRALSARMKAQEWPVPGSVAARVEALKSSLAAASTDDAIEWVERFPHAVLETMDRRRSATPASGTPRRRFVDIVREADVARGR